MRLRSSFSSTYAVAKVNWAWTMDRTLDQDRMQDNRSLMAQAVVSGDGSRSSINNGDQRWKMDDRRLKMEVLLLSFVFTFHL